MLLPPSMIVSPFSSSDCSAATVSSVTFPDGTMIQTPRGLVERGDQLVDARRRRRAECLDARACLRVRIVRDHRVVTVATEPVHHVGAHPAEPDKADLHGGESFDVMAALSAPP